MTWQDVQDEQINNALNQYELVYNCNSKLRRFWGLCDNFILDKHFINVFSCFKKHDSFRLLDIGCGQGKLLQVLANYFSNAEFIGIDTNVNSIEQASKNSLPNVSFLLLNYIETIQLGTFDMVICSEVYEHIDDPNNLLFYLQKLVKDNGFLSISTPSGWMYRIPRISNIKMLLKNPRAYFANHLFPEKHWSQALYIHPAIKPKKLIRMLNTIGFKLLNRQSSLWLFNNNSLILRLFNYCEKRGFVNSGIKFYYLLLGLEVLMNRFTPLRVFESRFVLLMEKA